MPIRALAALGPKQELKPFEYEPGPLGAHEVEVQVAHCGICHSDVHLIDNDWGFSTYPLVPGHEVVGTVAAAGASVAGLKPGDRVGVGWQAGSCGHCEWCGKGVENLCSSQTMTCVDHYGGYADRVRANARFVLPVPKALNAADAAPLLCGGITVYTPLRLYGIGSHMHVGVFGIGGLGHLAVRFARAFGCEVTAFSTSASKRAEALRFGAHNFVDTSQTGALATVRGQYDFLVSTAPASLDWPAVLDALRPKGILCLVGVPEKDMQVPAFPLIAGQKTICGSNIGSPSMLREMLAFAARHGISAQTERFPLQDANAALQHVRAGRARYRVVLDA